MRPLLLMASREREDFHDLIGKTVTFASDIIDHSGNLMHQKGEEAYISDVEYTPAFYSAMYREWSNPNINTVKINNVYGSWRPDAFIEFTRAHQHAVWGYSNDPTDHSKEGGE